MTKQSKTTSPTYETRDGYLTSRDRLKLYYRERMLEAPKGSIILVHGVGEHYGRYRHVEEALSRAGYNFHMMDLRGHGQSDGIRVHVDRFDRYLEDLDLLVSRVQQAHQGPIFLVGHSLGGLIAVRYLETRTPRFAGVVLSGAALKPTIKPPLPIFLALRAISVLRPHTPVPGLVPVRYICRDTNVVVRYATDPLVHRNLTTGFGMASIDAMERSLAEARKIDLPILILHGGDDKIVARSASDDLYRKVRSVDKTLKIYPGCYHESSTSRSKTSSLATCAGGSTRTRRNRHGPRPPPEVSRCSSPTLRNASTPWS